MDIQIKPELLTLIEQLIPLDEEDLCVFIGNENFKSELSSNFLTPTEIIKKVKKWIHSQATDIRERICGDEIVKQEILQGKLEKKILVGHISALLTGIGHTEVTIAAIAVYYINYGYKEICNDKNN